MSTLKALREQIDQKKKQYSELANKVASSQLQALNDEIKQLNAELSAVIAKGSKVCPLTGHAAIGMHQEVLVKGKPLVVFEVGSSVLRSLGFTPELAVAAWNEEDYIKPAVAVYGRLLREVNPKASVRELIRACRRFRKASPEEQSKALGALEAELAALKAEGALDAS